MILSFIIPVYNCQDYLPRCINSILAINSIEYEVILVNDGSTDDSGLVCEKLKNEHDNIVYLKQDNRGASSARNAGLKVAKGDYIWFVDADDEIVSTILIDVIPFMNNGTNVICFNYNKIFPHSTQTIIDYDNARHERGMDFLKLKKRSYLWNKIFKRNVIGSHVFVEGTKNLEDMYFNLEVLSETTNVISLNVIGYKYYQDNVFGTSRNRSLRNLVKLSQDSMTFHSLLIDKVNGESDGDRKSFYAERLNMGIAGHLLSIFKFYNPKFMKKIISSYELLGVYPAGDTGNKKANRFLLLANRKHVFISVFQIICFFKKYF